MTTDCLCSRRRPSAAADEIDFLAAYIIAEDTWFIIPIRAFTPLRRFSFYPPGAPTEAATSSIVKPGGCWRKRLYEPRIEMPGQTELTLVIANVG